MLKGMNTVKGNVTEPKRLGDTAPRTDHSTNDKMGDGVALYEKRVEEWELNKNEPVHRANNKKLSLILLAKDYGLSIAVDVQIRLPLLPAPRRFVVLVLVII